MRRSIIIWGSLFLLLTLGCNKGSKKEGEETGDDPPTGAKISGRIISLEQPLASQERRVQEFHSSRVNRRMMEIGEIIVMPQRKSDNRQYSVAELKTQISERWSGVSFDLEDGPYYLLKAKEIREKYLRSLDSAALVGGTEASLDEQNRLARPLEEETMSLADQLNEMQEYVKVAAPNFVRNTQQTFSSDEQWVFKKDPTLLNLHELYPGESFKKEVSVAVIDSGVMLNHPSLQANILQNSGFDFVSDRKISIDGDGPDLDPNPPNADGTSFHGTHVAGIVAGHSSENNTFYSVAGASHKVKIIPIRALGFNGQGNDYDIARAILFAAGLLRVEGREPRQADIINLSLGGPGESPILSDAIAQAAEKGVIIVAAAGNDGGYGPQAAKLPSYPAAYPEVIGVGALGPVSDEGRYDDRFAEEYSNTGINVDVVAPGGGGPHYADRNHDGILDGIYSTSGGTTLNFEGYPSVEFEFMSGTSMASPHVAGIVGMMIGLNPTLGAGSIRELLYTHADPPGAIKDCSPQKCGRGKVNALKTLEAIPSDPIPELVARLDTEFALLTPESSSQTFLIERQGEGELKKLDLHTQVISKRSYNWLSEPLVTSGDRGLELTVSASRAGLPDGAFVAYVDVVTNAAKVILKQDGEVAREDRSGVIRFTVRFQVGQFGPENELYVALTRVDDPKQVVKWTKTTKEQNFEFSFKGLSDGEYFLYAGSDHDGDQVICETGDSCGVFPSLDRERKVKNTLENVSYNFPVHPVQQNKYALDLSKGEQL